jgi:fermentation-respiration switch protein FrsA (DUF1100 family)
VTDRTLTAWTTADIDAALVVVRSRHTAALEQGDLVAAETHEGWMNRLLDARKYHRKP